MHLAMIMDDERLLQEQGMLNRLTIGLMAEGVRVTRVVSDAELDERLAEGEQRVALATRIEAPMRVLPWMRKARVAAVVEAFDRSRPDVLYAIGEPTWSLADDLAAAIDRPLLLDVHSMAMARHVMRQHWRAASCGCVAPCKAIAQALAQRLGAARVSVVPMGVAMPAPIREAAMAPSEGAPASGPEPRSAFPAVAILGRCGDVPAYQALLRGLAAVVRDMGSMQIILELRGQHDHEIWREAQRLELMPAISAIGDAAWYRSLLLECDLVLLPDSAGEVRSIILEAMAHSLPVVAADDPALDMLVNGATAAIVNRTAPDEWSAQVQRCLTDREWARRLGGGARQIVQDGHRSSMQVQRLLELLERLVEGPLRLAGESA